MFPGVIISLNFKDEICTAAGSLQTCASHGVGAEAAIHRLKEIFEDDSTESVLLIDASNTFNRMNRSAALHNIRYQCASLSTYLIKRYRQESRLFITGGGKIASKEGTTQEHCRVIPYLCLGKFNKH